MILLTDEAIEEIDIHCGMSEIDGTEPFSSYKYEHHLLKAQLKKVVELIIADSEGFDGYNQSPVIVSHKLWQSLLEEGSNVSLLW